jgi:pyruvate-formate lyase
MDWLAQLYANTMNIIHYMHDKYDYERLEMALHDTHVSACVRIWCHQNSVCGDHNIFG